MQLSIGTTLQGGEFVIEKMLGQGGFGITYLATQRSLNRKVAIKEFFINDYCRRDDDGRSIRVLTHSKEEFVTKNKARFLREAQFIANLIHPHIVTIYSIFEENATVYYVMEFLQGGSLFELATEHPLDENTAISYVTQIASALSLMHSKEQTHLDVKPSNIMLRDDKTSVLIDFGLTKQFENGNQMTSTRMAFTPHYAPLEQHKGVREFLPCIDIYALGATLYFLLTGKNPPMADDVFNDGLPSLPSHISIPTRKAIEAAMQPRAKDRPASMNEFINMLSTSCSSEPSYSDRQALVNPTKTIAPPKERKIIDTKPTAPLYIEHTDTNKPSIISQVENKIQNIKLYKNQIGILTISIIAIIAIIAITFIYPKTEDTIKKNLHSGEITEDTIKENLHSGEIVAKIVNGVSFDMVVVEGGTFTMGATSEQGSDPENEEYPTHQVTLSDYMIGKTEVTQELWQAVMGSNPSNFSGNNLPVEQVSWNECQEFIKKLNSLMGLQFRLPTEAEWEYAARGGNKSKGYKYSGSNDIGSVAWYTSTTNDSGTKRVATKAPNELGLYDMSGNVWEWCSDWYGSYSSGSQTNPKGPTSGSYRVSRGGSWFDSARNCRVSYRNNDNPDDGICHLGLRLAL